MRVSHYMTAFAIKAHQEQFLSFVALRRKKKDHANVKHIRPKRDIKKEHTQITYIKTQGENLKTEQNERKDKLRN